MRDAAPRSSPAARRSLVSCCSRGLRDGRAAAARDPRRSDDAVRRRGASTRRRSATRSRTAKARWAAPACGRRMRVQLTRARRARRGSSRVAPVLAVAGRARAQVVDVDTTHTRLLRGADPDAHVRVLAVGRRAGLALVVARRARRLGGGRRLRRERRHARPGARTAPRTAPTSSRTASVHDFRNVGRGEVDAQGRRRRRSPRGYAYGTEHDYRSNSFHVSARTDAFQHNTQFELAYAHNFDTVCDRVQDAARADAPDPVDARSRTRPAASPRPPDAHDARHRRRHLRGELVAVVDARHRRRSSTYTRAARRRLPERSVPQRHPRRGRSRRRSTSRTTARARPSTLRGAYYLRPIKGALRLSLRGYHDTWDIDSGTAEVEVEKSLGECVPRHARAAALYQQSGARLLERRLHRRRPAARAEGAVLDRATASSRRSRAGSAACALAVRASSPADQPHPRLHPRASSSARRPASMQWSSTTTSTRSAARRWRTRSPTWTEPERA